MAPELCRVWWPQRRLQPESLPVPQRLVLFEWLFALTGSVDVVVAAALPQEEILRSFPTPEALQVNNAHFPYLFPSNLRHFSPLTLIPFLTPLSFPYPPPPPTLLSPSHAATRRINAPRYCRNNVETSSNTSSRHRVRNPHVQPPSSLAPTALPRPQWQQRL
uniref:Uncharacterized protein n=1 Tax=Oryza punctata TaxID=4537 RepID=A0A0E0L0M5_ORYPU